MDTYAYQSFEETRTASANARVVKSVQSWKSGNRNPENIHPTPAQSKIIASLNDSVDNKTAGFATSLKHVNAYAPTAQNRAPINTAEGFQFGDVIDAINPLHHLPLVGMAYREFTGDDLHPVSGIIGGALYGGPVGAVTGTANAVSKIQTGKDFGEHAFSLFKTSTPVNEPVDKPLVQKYAVKDQLPHIEKAYSTPQSATKTIQMEKLESYPFFDDITTLQLAAMPPKQLF